MRLRHLGVSESRCAEDVRRWEWCVRHRRGWEPHCAESECLQPCLSAGVPTGVIRSLHKMGRLEHTFCTETRPYNQGARLTAFELIYEQIPATLIADSMAAAAMAHKGVSGQWAGHGGVDSALGIQSHACNLPNSPPNPQPWWSELTVSLPMETQPTK